MYKKNKYDPKTQTPLENDLAVDEESVRFHKLLKLIFTLCELSGFHLEGRITVKDAKSGRVWR